MRRLEWAGRDHDVVGFEALPACRENETPALPTPECVDADAPADRELEVRRVGFEVVGHLEDGREGVLARREWHSGKTVAAGRREQSHRVPAVAPGVADALVGVEDHERASEPGQVVADRQSGLAATDHDRLDPLDSPLRDALWFQLHTHRHLRSR